MAGGYVAAQNGQLVVKVVWAYCDGFFVFRDGAFGLGGGEEGVGGSFVLVGLGDKTLEQKDGQRRQSGQ